LSEMARTLIGKIQQQTNGGDLEFLRAQTRGSKDPPWHAPIFLKFPNF
jgi:hypothetical protein